ncbi:MAG: intermembrane transport protein PqiB [Burkholderiales bacterium]
MTREELPKARVRRRRLPSVAWLVPLVAVLVAGYLVWDRLRERGPEIVISFADGAGVRVGVTPVKYRGVVIGEVSGVGLSEDHRKALVRVRLQRSAASIAREGTRFWIVRPQVGFGNITGLDTVLTGPEIQALPAEDGGAARREFAGLDSAPVGMEAEGLKLVLRAERPRSIRPNTPVHYRGVEVGLVQKVDLGPNSTSADVHVLIFERYAGLVRQGSAFWNTSGVNVKGGILKGIEVEVESLRAIATGGIEFATPSAKAARVRPGAVFFLHDEPKPEWLSWLPRIPVPEAK